jgi:CheY-like chemotaxis protein
MVPLETSGQGLRVLVVDGLADAADSLVLLLDLWGYQARAAYNAGEALDLAQHFHPDVVLTELYLPQKDGFSLAKALGRQAILVAVTTLPPGRHRQQAMEMGFAHYFLKPADPEQLRAVLADLTRAEPSLAT